jgi:hypothetical protein
MTHEEARLNQEEDLGIQIQYFKDCQARWEAERTVMQAEHLAAKAEYNNRLERLIASRTGSPPRRTEMQKPPKFNGEKGPKALPLHTFLMMAKMYMNSAKIPPASTGTVRSVILGRRRAAVVRADREDQG